MAEHTLSTPLKNEDIEKLKAGDTVKLSGTIYTARDAAHKRLVAMVHPDKGGSNAQVHEADAARAMRATWATQSPVIVSGPRVSPAMMTVFVVQSVSQATRTSRGSMPWRIASEK